MKQHLATTEMLPSVMTLGKILEFQTDRFPNKTALIDANTNISLTYMHYRNLVRQVASKLSDLGITTGDAVYVDLRKGIELPIFFLAIARIGAIVIPFSQHHDSLLAEKFVGLLPPKALIVSLINREEILYQPFFCSTMIVMSEELLSMPATPSDKELPLEIESSAVCLASRNSAQAANPKVVKTTHSMIIHNALSATEAYSLNDTDIFFSGSSASDYPYDYFSKALILGATTVLYDSDDISSIIKVIQTNGITFLSGTVDFYQNLIAAASFANLQFPTIRIAEVSGGPPTLCLFKRWSRIAHCLLTPVWGTPETTGAALWLNPLQFEAGQLGQPLPGYSVKLLKENGEVCVDEEVGNLTVEGPAVFTQYVGDDRKYSRFVSGDLAIRRDGALLYLGRTESQIVVNGEPIYPFLVEECLLRHPAVDEAVVVPFHKSNGKVTARALILLSPGEQAGAEFLRDYLHGHLEPQQVPEMIEIWEEFPRLKDGGLNRESIALSQPKSGTTSLSDLGYLVKKIDRQILDLINQRATVILKMQHLNGTVNMGLFDASQEAEALLALLAHNSGPLYDSTVESIFRLISLSCLHHPKDSQ